MCAAVPQKFTQSSHHTRNKVDYTKDHYSAKPAWGEGGVRAVVHNELCRPWLPCDSEMLLEEEVHGDSLHKLIFEVCDKSSEGSPGYRSYERFAVFGILLDNNRAGSSNPFVSIGQSESSITTKRRLLPLP